MKPWTPKESDYATVFQSQNPWHVIGLVPHELAPRTYRPLALSLWKTLINSDSRRHQLILGPRRVGKTTVMYQTVAELIAHGVRPDRLWWVRLDHPLLLEWALGDMMRQIITNAGASAAEPVYVFLDELTYADNWDLWLKTFFDERWPIRLVGTSSATAAIRQRGTESGVGRWDEQYLAPYLFTEFLDLKGIATPQIACESSLDGTIRAVISAGPTVHDLAPHRRRFLFTGGFPELLVQTTAGDEASQLLRSQSVLRSDAIEKAVYKDIPQAFSIQDPAKLERLLYVLAGQLTGILSPNTIAADIDMAAATVEKYVNFLERAFIVFTLNTFSASEETVQRRGKKLFFVDAAVRNAALLRGIAPASDPKEMGLITENTAASHLRALAYQESVRCYHWRDKGIEIDLVYDHPDAPLAFELTTGKSHSQRGMTEFQKRFPKFRGKCFLVSVNPEVRAPTNEEVGLLPLDLFLLAVGRQEQYALLNRIASYPQKKEGQLLLF